ncbi:MAG: EscF/YscF/HrpA family type III secretion system needle major subunit [Candidatus Oxydemutatoraceae bacterium WSBS_2016_MAG_OTU14]
MGLTLDQLSNSVAPAMNKEENKLTDMLNTIDVTNPTSMVKLQMEYTKYSTEVGMLSTLAKDIKDACSQVIQRS